jgi:murein DD-endopeptidase MepM/ murein hydrolase activator NlpD
MGSHPPAVPSTWPEDGGPSLVSALSPKVGPPEGTGRDTGARDLERDRLRRELAALEARLADARARLVAARAANDALETTASARRDIFAAALLAGLGRARGASGAESLGARYAAQVGWMAELRRDFENRSRQIRSRLAASQREVEALSADLISLRSSSAFVELDSYFAQKPTPEVQLGVFQEQRRDFSAPTSAHNFTRSEDERHEIFITDFRRDQTPNALDADPVPDRPIRFRMPLEASIVGRFGDRRGGQRLRGLVLSAHRAQPVLAPSDGLVAYAGPFRDLGLVLIIEHRDAYHSLVIGASRLEVRVGDAVTQGQVVGWLERNASGGRDIYLELRRGGEPIDPVFVLSTHVGEVQG